jgi:hypothetical protein
VQHGHDEIDEQGERDDADEEVFHGGRGTGVRRVEAQ